jgi:4-hydroxy-4-methyl-2-oxoglutarate aldolase
MPQSISKAVIDEFMQLSTPNVSDALDRLKIDGAPRGILPLYACSKIVGPAATLKLVPPDQAVGSAVNGTLEAVASGEPGGVLVIDNSGRPDINSYGGIAGATTKHKGLVGCVSDGPMRDVDEYKALGLPVYGQGIVQQSIRGRSACAGYDIEIQLNGVRVRPKDLVIADDNGVVIVPKEQVTEVLQIAKIVKETEDRVIADIRSGTLPVEAHEKVRYDQLLKAS